MFCIVVAIGAIGSFFVKLKNQRREHERTADEIAAVDALELAAALSAVADLEGQDAVAVLEGQDAARQAAHDLAEALELSEALATVEALEESAQTGAPELEGGAAAVVPPYHLGGGSAADTTEAHGRR